LSVRTRANVSARPRANTRGRAAVSLRYNCNFCALTGTFPDAFTPAKFPRLQQAYWDGNGFSGTLPGSIGSLPSLTVRPTFDQHNVCPATPARRRQFLDLHSHSNSIFLLRKKKDS
jgi:hypothetical protein